MTTSESSRKYNVSERNIRRWLEKGVDRKQQGRGPQDVRMEQQLAQEIHWELAQGRRLSKQWVLGKSR
jgi:hypothetical protein